jgi:GAF domain-containing protein
MLVLKASQHKDPESHARLHEFGPARPLKVGEGIAGTIFRTQQPYVARDIETDPLITPADKASLGSGSVVTAPLHVRGRGIGILYWIRTGRTRPLTEAVAPLAARLANLVAVAIDNAQLYQEMEAKVAERTADLQSAHERLEALVAADRHELTDTTLKLRSRLQNVIGYADLLDHLVESSTNQREVKKDYLNKMIASAEEVNGLVESLVARLQTDLEA